MIEIEFPDKTLFFPADKIVRQSFMRSGARIQKSARNDQRKAKHGRVYIIGGRRHVAAADGEAPGIISQSLLKSTRYEMKGSDMLFGAGTKRKVKYAKYLELGTKRMKPKPFIVKAVEKSYKDIEDDIKKASNDTL